MTRKELIADLIGITVKEADDLLLSISPLDPNEEILIARDEPDEEVAAPCYHILDVERIEEQETEDGDEISAFTCIWFQDDSLSSLDDEKMDERILD